MHLIAFKPKQTARHAGYNLGGTVVPGGVLTQCEDAEAVQACTGGGVMYCVKIDRRKDGVNYTHIDQLAEHGFKLSDDGELIDLRAELKAAKEKEAAKAEAMRAQEAEKNAAAAQKAAKKAAAKAAADEKAAEEKLEGIREAANKAEADKATDTKAAAGKETGTKDEGAGKDGGEKETGTKDDGAAKEPGNGG